MSKPTPTQRGISSRGTCYTGASPSSRLTARPLTLYKYRGMKKEAVEVIDETAATIQRAFQANIPNMSNIAIIEEAKSLNNKILQSADEVGPLEKSAIAETLIKLFDTLDARIKAAPLDNKGLPIVKGVKWKKNDPLAGIIEAISPFGMREYFWDPLIIKPLAPARRRRQKVTKYKFKDDVVEGRRPKVRRFKFTDDIIEGKRPKKESVRRLLKERYKLTDEDLDSISDILSRVSDAASLIDLLSALGLIGVKVSTVAGLLALPLFAISAGIALYDASNFTRTRYEMLCTAYTYTAWAFNEKPPPPSKTFLSKHKEGPLEHGSLHTAWKKTQKKVLRHLRQLCKKHKLKESDAKLGLRYYVARNNKERLIRGIIDQFVKRMSGKPPNHVDMVRVLKDYASIYPK